MRVYNETIIPAKPANTNITSLVAPLKYINQYSIVTSIRNAPTGTVAIQVSNDPETNDVSAQPPPKVWVTVSTTTVTSAGNIIFSDANIGYNYVRVVYTDTSGGTSTATIQVIFNGKGF